MARQMVIPGVELPQSPRSVPAPHSHIRSAMHEAANRIAKHLPEELDTYLASLTQGERDTAVALGSNFAAYAVMVARRQLVDAIKETAETVFGDWGSDR